MYEIEITSKKGFKNVRGENVLSDILDLGIKKVQKVDYSSLYIIDGELNLKEINFIASELLADKITENYKLNGFMTALPTIDVWYKKGVTDTVSESVKKAVKDLKINKDIKVKTGHRYYFHGKVSKPSLKKVAVKLLANTLIQDYKIEQI